MEVDVLRAFNSLNGSRVESPRCRRCCCQSDHEVAPALVAHVIHRAATSPGPCCPYPAPDDMNRTSPVHASASAPWLPRSLASELLFAFLGTRRLALSLPRLLTFCWLCKSAFASEHRGSARLGSGQRNPRERNDGYSYSSHPGRRASSFPGQPPRAASTPRAEAPALLRPAPARPCGR